MELEEAKKTLLEIRKELAWVEDVEAIDTVIAELFAMQNLLDEKNEELDRLQKENEELKNERDSYRAQVNSAFGKGFIHKDKIRELIENETIDIGGFECIALEDLQNLLKEE